MSNCKEWMKKGLAVASAVGVSALSLAQETGVTDYDTFLTELQTEVTDKLNAIWPILAAVLIIVVGFFLARWAWRQIRGAAGR